MTIPSNSRIPTRPYQKPRASRPGVLRLNSNEGSLPPGQLLSALGQEDISLIREYPDDDSLRLAIANYLGVAPQQIVVTAGADDALDRCCRTFLGPDREMILPVPEFEMLRRYGEIAGATIVPVPWEKQFPMASIISNISESTAAIFITSPNNPTGLTITAEELEKLCHMAGNTAVVLDHVYADYADEDLTNRVLEFPNLIVIRTFSKAWGLAGCRVGYAVASKPIIETLTSAGSPYPVSGLSLAITERRLLSNDLEFRNHIAEVRRLRPLLQEYLVNKGLVVAESQANFLFADFANRADDVVQCLEAQDILVRRFANRPAIQSCLRISIPGDQDNFDRLIYAFDKALPTAINAQPKANPVTN